MIIQALGGCCKKSQANYQNAVKAAAAAGLFVTVEHVTDPERILELGVLSTPGIVIDGKVMSSGRLATVAQILEMIEKRKTAPAEAKADCCEGGKCECEGDNCKCEDGSCDCASEQAAGSGQCCRDHAEPCCGNGKE